MVIYTQFNKYSILFEEGRTAIMRHVHVIVIVRISVLLLRRGLPFAYA